MARTYPTGHPHNFKDITGQRFGRWVVLELCQHQNGKARWVCRCDCGAIKQVYGDGLRNGKSTSCGCYVRTLIIQRCTTHGMTGTPEYQAWNRMWRRCTVTTDPDYIRYGERGIHVCARWTKFDAFISDMGRRPSSDYSLDRIDVDGNYEPDNCRWATRSEQNNNKRTNVFITANNETRTMAQWARHLGITSSAIHARIHRQGLTPEQAVTQQIGHPYKRRKNRDIPVARIGV